MNLPISNILIARSWVARNGGSVRGQRKDTRGKPVESAWQILKSDLSELPVGVRWLLKAGNGKSTAVLLKPYPAAQVPAAPEAAGGTASGGVGSAQGSTVYVVDPRMMPSAADYQTMMTTLRQTQVLIAQTGQAMAQAQIAVTEARRSEKDTLKAHKEVIETDNEVQGKALQWTGLVYVAERMANVVEIVLAKRVLGPEDLNDFVKFKKFQAKLRAKKAIQGALESGQAEPTEATSSPAA